MADIEEDSVSTTPTITSDGFTYEKVTTERRNHYSSGSDRETHVVQETLVATFTINGADPYVRAALTNWRYVPEKLHVKFESTNYGEWTVDIRHCFINGNSMQQDGSRGHQSIAHWFEWPDWGRALVERGGDGHSAAFDWLQTQYPRRAVSE
jgi:hypothetical protein